jgi:hypothetical protein
MIQKFTPDNTVGQGLRADVFIGAETVKHCFTAYKIGPFVLARCFRTDAAGKFVLALGGDQLAECWHFGLGRVHLSPLAG